MSTPVKTQKKEFRPDELSKVVYAATRTAPDLDSIDNYLFSLLQTLADDPNIPITGGRVWHSTREDIDHFHLHEQYKGRKELSPELRLQRKDVEGILKDGVYFSHPGKKGYNHKLEQMLGVTEYAGIHITTPEGEEYILATDIKTKEENREFILESLAKLRQFIEEGIERHSHQKEEQKAQTQLRSLLPKIPNIQGLDIAGECQFQESVGGDVFDLMVRGYETSTPDAIEILPEKITCSIMDAEGHGLAAAFRAIQAYDALKAGGLNNLKVVDVMRTANELMYMVKPDGRLFTSAFYLEFFPNSEFKFTYTNAGHPSPLHYKEKDDRIRKLSVPDPEKRELEHFMKRGMYYNQQLGRFPNVKYNHNNGQFRPGDIILMYSDGITEAKNVRGEQYGIERLSQALRQSRQLAAKEMIVSIFADVDKFCEQAPPDDDRTLFVIKRDSSTT